VLRKRKICDCELWLKFRLLFEGSMVMTAFFLRELRTIKLRIWLIEYPKWFCLNGTVISAGLSSDGSPGRMEGGAGRERTRSETLIPLNVSAKVSILLADDPVDRRAALPSFSIKASRLSASGKPDCPLQEMWERNRFNLPIFRSVSMVDPRLRGELISITARFSIINLIFRLYLQAIFPLCP
jgi:hypothetical protein